MSSPAFNIRLGEADGEVHLSGRLDASECDAALNFLNRMPHPHVIDFAGLEYISSAGLRVILLTQKRCKALGGGVKVVNVSASIVDIFRYAGFDQILDVVPAAG